MYQSGRNSVKEYTDTVMEFGGVNQRTRGNENEFSDMLNMSSDGYPLLSPRKRRAVVYESTSRITALKNKEALLWCENKGAYSRFYVNAYEQTFFRSTDTKSERHIVGMGAYAVLFPDKKYINLLDYTDKGSLENKFTLTGMSTANGIKIVPCMGDGTELTAKAVSNTAPAEPKGGDVWVDISGEKSVYKKWDSATKQWVQLSTTYIKLFRTGIANGFSKWDTVSIRGLLAPNIFLGAGNYTTEGTQRIKAQVEALNTDGVIIYDADTSDAKNYLVVAGVLDSLCYIVSGETTIERKVPDMDFVIECNNRLWGCKYGLVDGKVVNEIYCCRQGDFRNWYAYLGISTDSYAVTVGSEGAFTGAAVFNKNPVFFKQDCIHQIYGSTPSSFQLVTTNCEGVEKGQGDSVCVADNVLYYKGPTGFFAYTGSLPQKISRNLTDTRHEHVIGEGVGDKVYFACGARDGAKTIYVYDTYYGLWHKEDQRAVQGFSRDGHILYMLIYENGESSIVSVSDEADVSLNINDDSYPKYEKTVQWAAESVDIGYGDINMKYVSKLTLRAKLGEGARVKVSVSCDGEPYERVGVMLYEQGVHTCEIAFAPKRCEFFRYKIEGVGDAKIISIKKKIGQGSERP